MKSKVVILRTGVVAGVVLTLLIYLLAPWLAGAWLQYGDWRKLAGQKRALHKAAKEKLRHYENLPVPKLSPEEVVKEMRNQGGLPLGNRELGEMVEYHVYWGDQAVITQLVANLPFEVELELPEESTYGTSVWLRDVKGKSLSILRNEFQLLKHISPALHQEFHSRAPSEPDPHLIYLIMALIVGNDRNVMRPENDPNYIEGGGAYFDIPWYTSKSVAADVLAYVHVYVRFRDWPTIRGSVESRFCHYPGDWLDWRIMREILRLADEKGVEAAYEAFLEWF